MGNFFNRVLLKLSGEALQGSDGCGINADTLNNYALQIRDVVRLGVQAAVVVGGGNIFRGWQGTGRGFDRVSGDQMGMLATTINSLGLQNALENAGIPAQTFTAVNMQPIGKHYSPQEAQRFLADGGVAVVAGGTGNPFFSTDTAAALRAAELQADCLLKGTRVDGVYSADPEKDPNAVRYEHISFDEAIEKGLRVMDLTAFTLCRENRLRIIVFDITKKGSLRSVIETGRGGTLIDG